MAKFLRISSTHSINMDLVSGVYLERRDDREEPVFVFQSYDVERDLHGILAEVEESRIADPAYDVFDLRGMKVSGEED